MEDGDIGKFWKMSDRFSPQPQSWAITGFGEPLSYCDPIKTPKYAPVQRKNKKVEPTLPSNTNPI